MPDINITNGIVAAAALIQAIFTIVLVFVYIRRQTCIMDKQQQIMNEQKELSDQQFEWSRAMFLNSEYPKILKTLEEEKAKLQLERETFYGEKHSKSEIQQFDEMWKAKELNILINELGSIGTSKYLESIANDYVQILLTKLVENTDFVSAIHEEILSLGYSEESFKKGWAKLLNT